MIIYGSSLSPYVRKTIVFATEKGLDFEVVMAGAQGGPPEIRTTRAAELEPRSAQDAVHGQNLHV